MAWKDQISRAWETETCTTISDKNSEEDGGHLQGSGARQVPGFHEKMCFFGWNWIIVQVILAIKAWICGFWTAHGTCQSGVVWLDVDFELVFQAMPYARPTCQHQARRKNDSRMKIGCEGWNQTRAGCHPANPTWAVSASVAPSVERYCALHDTRKKMQAAKPGWKLVEIKHVQGQQRKLWREIVFWRFKKGRMEKRREDWRADYSRKE